VSFGDLSRKMRQTEVPLARSLHRCFKLIHQMAPGPPTSSIVAIAKFFIYGFLTAKNNSKLVKTNKKTIFL